MILKCIQNSLRSLFEDSAFLFAGNEPPRLETERKKAFYTYTILVLATVPEVFFFFEKPFKYKQICVQGHGLRSFTSRGISPCQGHRYTQHIYIGGLLISQIIISPLTRSKTRHRNALFDAANVENFIYLFIC